jgi:hypothetical protein
LGGIAVIFVHAWHLPGGKKQISPDFIALTGGALFGIIRLRMSPGSLRLILRLFALVAVPFALMSCSSASVGNGARISRVKYYHLIPGNPISTQDPALIFERQHYLYGAVTKAEMLSRTGHYYTVFWKVDDRAEPVTVRFEYRQANTGLATKVVEQQVEQVRRSNTTRFQVTGDEYNTGGRVTAWKLTLLRGKDELVSQRSYMWN